MRGVSELARMTPEAVEEQVRRAARALPRARGARGRDLRQPARRPRASGRGLAAKWINQYDGLDNVIAHADEITGKTGEALREHLGDVIRNRQLNALVRDLDLELAPGRPRGAAVGPRSEVHTLFDGLEFRVLRDRLCRDPAVRGGDRRLRLRARRRAGSAPARSPAGWRSTPADAGRTGRAPCRAAGAPAPARSWSVALAAADGAAAWVDAGEVTPEDDAALAAWLGDADAAQGAARRQGPDARAGGARLAAAPGWSATPRCRRTSPGPTSAPTTWPT